MERQVVRVNVLLRADEAERLAAYCRGSARKKSTLIAMLVRKHLDEQGVPQSGTGR
jgi:hypothetical protein